MNYKLIPLQIISNLTTSSKTESDCEKQLGSKKIIVRKKYSTKIIADSIICSQNNFHTDTNLMKQAALYRMRHIDSPNYENVFEETDSIYNILKAHTITKWEETKNIEKKVICGYSK